MDITTALTIFGIVVAIVIGLWQIQLARKQIHLSKNQKGVSRKEANTLSDTDRHDISINDYKERPSPSEIFYSIQDLPVLQQESARSNYMSGFMTS